MWWFCCSGLRHDISQPIPFNNNFGEKFRERNIRQSRGVGERFLLH